MTVPTPEVQGRAMKILAQDKRGSTFLRQALKQAEQELLIEEENKKYDLDLIEKEMSEHDRRHGTYSGDTVKRLLAAARHYQEQAASK